MKSAYCGWRFGLDDGHQRTLEEVGRVFEVTRERIRQIEAKALRKLRHPQPVQETEGLLRVGRTMSEARTNANTARMLKTDKRLRAAADWVEPCDVIADIGCDHGRLGAMLLLENRARYLVCFRYQ